MNIHPALPLLKIVKLVAIECVDLKRHNERPTALHYTISVHYPEQEPDRNKNNKIRDQPIDYDQANFRELKIFCLPHSSSGSICESNTARTKPIFKINVKEVQIKKQI